MAFYQYKAVSPAVVASAAEALEGDSGREMRMLVHTLRKDFIAALGRRESAIDSALEAVSAKERTAQ